MHVSVIVDNQPVNNHLESRLKVAVWRISNLDAESDRQLARLDKLVGAVRVGLVVGLEVEFNLCKINDEGGRGKNRRSRSRQA